jgi:hypothetical protein
MFAKARRRSSLTPAREVVSPLPLGDLDSSSTYAANHQHLQLHQRLELHSPVSFDSRPSADSVLPRISISSTTGSATSYAPRRSTIVSLQPPVLPPIPRVASRHEPEASSAARKERRANAAEQGQDKGAYADDSTPGTLASAAGPDAADSLSVTSSVPPSEIPSFANSDDYPEISFDEPRMEATMFPRPQPQPPSDPYTAGPPMSRSFIDSRDRPYSHNPQRPPPVVGSYSSPDVLPPRSATVQGLRQHEPIPTPRTDHISAVSLEEARKLPSATATNYSGSTARPSIQSSKSASASPLHQTIGTPYSETSASFPAPQHVTTRPKTLGSSSTIAGVMVPTHHSNGSYKDQAKPEKRKTRLLNPMALLARRRSGQDSVSAPDEAERRAQAHAQARQRLVASVGINSMPEDFDPRIKGKIVHDFNAPRTRRTISSSDADYSGISDRQSPSADGLPAISITPDQDQHRPSLHSAQRSDVSSRHSRHTPMFVEHLNEEPSTDGQTHGVHAERLENKDFLKRASHQSNPSQESSVLPPFARRSQQLDPMQASFYRDDDSSKRSSEQSSSGHRESSASSGAAVSPIAARASSSPISPEEPERNRRPVSDMSMIGGRFDAPFTSPTSESRGLPRVDPIAEHTPPTQHSDWSQAQSNSPPAPKAVHPALRNLASGPSSPRSTFPDSTSALSSPAFDASFRSTPEPHVADAVVSYQSTSTPARLVEKRASAVGHSKPASSKTPRHHASTTSRFSFQLDGSAAEERALEDKHRRIAGAQAAKKSPANDDEDEDGYFDEDAMDDEDEMEAEMRMNDHVGGNGMNAGFGGGSTGSHLQPPGQFSRSDASSVYEEDLSAPPKNPELTYAEHPAFRAHSAVYSVKHNSVAPSSRYSSDTSVYHNNNNDGWNPQHQRFTSDATIMTLADSDYGANGTPAPRGGFYMQPHAAGYGMGGGAGLNATGDQGFNADNTTSTSTAQSNGAQPQLAINTGASPRESQHPRFSGFKFIESPVHSRPATSEDLNGPFAMATGRASVVSPDNLPKAPVTSPMALPSTNSYAHGSNNEGESAPYHGLMGQGIRARNVSMNQNLQYAAPSESGTESTHDDMYFDDGGFSEDVQNSSGYGESINEEQFDNPDFAGGFRGMEPRGYHERHASAMTITSRDGPYPTFAMPNAGGKAQLRQSQMMLDDLPLQGPHDPQWVPQRNPSDDAKRLGLSESVPPLPPQPGANGASPQLAAYHQALADAANRAAQDGRFARNESVASTKSSVYSTRDEEEPLDRDIESIDDKNRKTKETEATAANAATNTAQPPVANSGVKRAESQNAPNPRYTLPRMSGFDFGFNANMFDDINAAPTDELNAAPSDEINAAPTDDFNVNYLEDGYDDEDDDVVAAANAEALAYDDSGFYGQEFGFYARARSNSAGSANGQALEAVNGGFFGDDGDDPLRRQNFSHEPDLTPITERSEFSARNSFINFGPASATWNHGGVASPALARLPLSPLAAEGGYNKARASGGGYFGVFPATGPAHSQSHQPFMGASPASATNSPARPWATSDSPNSATSGSSRGMPFASQTSGSTSALAVNAAADIDATPRKPQAHSSQMHFSSPLSEPPGTSKKAAPLPAIRTASGSASGSATAAVPTHSRNVSGADSVAYVRETVSPGVENSGPPRWVLERRRTSEFGVESVVGREVVKDGWI